MKVEERKKLHLGEYPTPLEYMGNLTKKYGKGRLYIKRDDFSGISLFGGNKIRKLEYLLGDAENRGCDYVFTYGATQSNHAMQTVSACRRRGLLPVLDNLERALESPCSDEEYKKGVELIYKGLWDFLTGQGVVWREDSDQLVGAVRNFYDLRLLIRVVL